MGGSELGVLLLGSWVLRELRYLNPSNNKSQTPSLTQNLGPPKYFQGSEVGGVHQTGMLNEIPKSPRKITIPKFQHPSTDPCPTEGFSVGHFPC